MMNLTDLEMKLLTSIQQSSETTGDNEKWVDEAFEDAGMHPTVGRGVLSSLVKKDLVTVGDNEGHGRPGDMFVCLTALGLSAT